MVATSLKAGGSLCPDKVLTQGLAAMFSRWHAAVTAGCLARQAQAYAQGLLEKQEPVPLLLQWARPQLRQWARGTFAPAALHVFGRGCASREWLGLLLAKQDRSLMRWPSAYRLADALGRAKRASLLSVGRKAASAQLVWGMSRKRRLRRSLLRMPCLHPHYLDRPLTPIICRPGRKGRQPWRLLTNEEATRMPGGLSVPVPGDGR